MIRRLSCFVAGIVLLISASLGADDLLLARFGDYLEALRTQAVIPGMSAAVIGPSDVAWERVFGYRDLSRAIPVGFDTPFQLDDITQLFTAAIVLRCVEEGSLSLDDRIAQFDSDSPDANATIEQILTYTSGALNDRVFAYRPDRLAPLVR